MTALTLHADLQHLLGNLTIGGLFVFLLCRETGTGLSWFLLLAAGGLGQSCQCIRSVGHPQLGGCLHSCFWGSGNPGGLECDQVPPSSEASLAVTNSRGHWPFWLCLAQKAITLTWVHICSDCCLGYHWD
ncbi:MAG: hypothetical protein LWW87_09280 [Geobacteraceae bacterium]|nr:hypothetical protein [Geobacteraceae bacterium]